MITNKINTILNNSQQGDIDYTICNYIKMNLKEVAFMSIEELARKSYVSKAKISKFIKKLAYDNSQDHILWGNSGVGNFFISKEDLKK